MTKHLLTILFLVKAVTVFSQTKYTVVGKTDYITDGKAVLAPNPLTPWFYPHGLKNDTVPVRNHVFYFKGVLHSPASFSLICFDERENFFLSEPFFLDSGNQKLVFDSTTVKNDFWTSGQGIAVEGSKANDEYTRSFLPLYDHLNDEIRSYFIELRHYNLMTDKLAQRDSADKTEAKRISIRKESDSILNRYAARFPKSPIISWLIYDAASRHNYSHFYYKAFDRIKTYQRPEVRSGLKAYLDKQKIKGEGRRFPLRDFIQANISAESRHAKFTLVDFWFSACGPCIFNFNKLKSIYNTYHDKGFNIVAISIDKKEAIADYERTIKKYQYTWDQVLDLNGLRTKSLNINIFPTSFLLDQNGKIIKTFINPILLNTFLERNL
ncbi:thiol-disulfide isomerase/thioredoxin [Mucilaginibacter oryzae]|uniref:Thiol-disulfide isomerase/thioredoxin n=1 Tax=Mucilaginibacter oryzae TaxID=468058 RepID=A0A316HI80_9SPHI|nr:TlpA disulfide reductase family protein [Mucilaginibacter oryzae]PWK80338.1 thiol-disulfide isomerase/thioredoxin [Mucilaginibacter oryzae]